MIYTTNTDLVEYSTASELAATYKEQTERIGRLMIELGEAVSILHDAFNCPGSVFSYMRLSAAGRDRYELNSHGFEELQLIMRQQAWAHLIDKIGIRTLMSTKEVEKLNSVLQEGRNLNELPDIEPETIIEVINGYFASAGELLTDMIREEYDWLRPRDEKGHKTNSPYRINRKVIIVRWLNRYDEYKRSLGWGHHAPHFRSLNNIMRLLDGKGPSQSHHGELLDAMMVAEGDSFETEYFSGRLYRNGNIHLTFLRADLLERFNLIGAGGALVSA